MYPKYLILSIILKIKEILEIIHLPNTSLHFNYVTNFKTIVLFHEK